MGGMAMAKVLTDEHHKSCMSANKVNLVPLYLTSIGKCGMRGCSDQSNK